MTYYLYSGGPEPRPVPRRHCSLCNDTHYVSISFFGKRGPLCTCGAGDPADEMTLHAADCDSVPCPLDQLLQE
jgi:hypothetical protein